MARLVGVDLPNDKRLEVALTYIYGIGRTRASIKWRCREHDRWRPLPGKRPAPSPRRTGGWQSVASEGAPTAGSVRSRAVAFGKSSTRPRPLPLRPIVRTSATSTPAISGAVPRGAARPTTRLDWVPLRLVAFVRHGTLRAFVPRSYAPNHRC